MTISNEVLDLIPEYAREESALCEERFHEIFEELKKCEPQAHIYGMACYIYAYCRTWKISPLDFTSLLYGAIRAGVDADSSEED